MLSDDERLQNVEWLRAVFSDAGFDEATALLAVADLFRSIWWESITHHLPCETCAPNYRPEDAEGVIESVVSELENYFQETGTQTLEEDGMVLMFLLESLAALLQHDVEADAQAEERSRPTYRIHGDVIEVDFQRPESPPAD